MSGRTHLYTGLATGTAATGALLVFLLLRRLQEIRLVRRTAFRNDLKVPIDLPPEPWITGSSVSMLTRSSLKLLSSSIPYIGSPEASKTFLQLLINQCPHIEELIVAWELTEHSLAETYKSLRVAIKDQLHGGQGLNKLLREWIILGTRHNGYAARLDHIYHINNAFADMLCVQQNESGEKITSHTDVHPAWESFLYMVVGELGPRLLMEEDLRSFSAALSNELAAPAGGTCVALAGAQGASLLAMAAALTRAPKAGTTERTTINEARYQLVEVRWALEELGRLDMTAYCRVMAAVRQPALQQGSARHEAMSAALEQAARVPLQAAEWSAAGLRIACVLVNIVAKSGLGDAGAGVNLLVAACRTSLQNVRINTHTKLIQHCDWCWSLNARAQALSDEVEKLEKMAASTILDRSSQRR